MIAGVRNGGSRVGEGGRGRCALAGAAAARAPYDEAGHDEGEDDAEDDEAGCVGRRAAAVDGFVVCAGGHEGCFLDLLAVCECMFKSGG